MFCNLSNSCFVASAKAATPSTPANQSSVTESLEEGTGNPEWDALQREKKELKKAIYVWTKDFVTQHQREPTKEEREGDAKDMFKRYRTVCTDIVVDASVD